MWGLLRGALGLIFSSIFTGGAVKFLFLGVIFYLVSIYTEKIISFLPEITEINQVFGDLPSGVWYFINLFALDTGISIIISATITGFLLKRILFA